MHTLTTRLLEANLLASTGDISAAQEKCKSLLSEMTRALGIEHPSTLGARYLEVWLMSETGDDNAALEKLSDLIPVIEHAHDAEHPDALQARSLRADILANLGDVSEAIEEWHAVLLSLRAKMRDTHPRVREILEKIENHQRSANAEGAGLPVP